MKKKNLKSLSLNKNRISDLKSTNEIIGKGTSGCWVTDYCTEVSCNLLTITGCDYSYVNICHGSNSDCWC